MFYFLSLILYSGNLSHLQLQKSACTIVTVSVRPSVTKLQRSHRPTTDTMSEYNENLLAGVWWVILNSLDLFHFLPESQFFGQFLGGFVI